MDRADEIWNRATTGGGESPREGDIALAASLAFHGLVMNGGVLHAFEVLSAEELGRARDGFTWLGMPEVAHFLEDTARSIAETDWDDNDAGDALEASTDESYDRVLPSDQALEDAFRRLLAERPQSFDPV
jgi:hypothetical protein